jgi:hypothetical protein
MQYPAQGEPHRPTRIQVRPGGPWPSLRPHLGHIGIPLVVTDALDHCDGLFRQITERVSGKPRPGLLAMPGVTPEQVGSFYEAAAQFFRQAPWKRVGGSEAAIRVGCAKYQSGPWYAVLMGQAGLTTGLALYDDLGTLRRLWAGGVADGAMARQAVGMGVTFGEEWDLPVADLEAVRRYGWPVARPDAYPSIAHKDRGLTTRPPLAWELELAAGCLRAVPEFVARRPQDDPAQEEMTVPVASGELTLVLSWVVDEAG